MSEAATSVCAKTNHSSSKFTRVRSQLRFREPGAEYPDLMYIFIVLNRLLFFPKRLVGFDPTSFNYIHIIQRGLLFKIIR